MISFLISIALTTFCPQKAEDPASLVPAHTMLYFGASSMRAAADSGRGSAMQMILSEPEVKAFLQKPLAAADKALQEMVKQADLGEAGASRFSLAEMMGGEGGPSVGKLFLALTHVSLPTPGAGVLSPPDVGLVVGIELLNAEDLGMIKALWSRIPFPEESATHEGRAYFVKTEPAEEGGYGFKLALAFLDNLAVASTSEKTLHEVMDRFGGKDVADGSLADTADYKKLVATTGGIPAAASSTIVRMAPLVELLRTTLASGLLGSGELADLQPKLTAVLDSLGLEAMKFAGSVSYRDSEGKIQSTSVLSLDKTVGGLVSRCLSSAKPVDLERVSGVPGNCLSMSLMSIDALAEIYDFFLSTFESLAPEEFPMVQGTIQQIMGERDLRNDILANIHGTLLTYSLPGEGFPGTPTTVARVGLRDGEAFVAGVKALFSGASAMFSPSGPATVTESVHETYPFYEVDLSSTPAGMLMMQMSPAFAIDGEELVISLQSAKTLKSVLNGTAGEGSLADNEAFMAFATSLAKKGELQALNYSDLAKTFGAAYTQLAGAAQMFGSMGDLPVDLALMPSEEAITKHLGHSYSGTYATDDGGTLVSRCIAQFQVGDFVPLLLTAGVLAATTLGDGGDMTEEPKEIEPLEKVQEDLAQISAGMTVYKIAQGSYPGAIDDLVKPLPDYPDGCLAKAEVPLDPWGNPYHFRLNEKKKPYLWSAGPDGVDQQGAGDDITKR